ncbi:FAD-dependent oxidoreductase [Isosphaera pallida]|uniref:FAD-dependent oxidoreductase n=1 Tax=Isosphaera pallida TaxID=128 RepID=UPI0002E4D433
MDPTGTDVIGGGVLGAFHAFHAAENRLRVVLIDRDRVPRGAPVHNGVFVATSWFHHKIFIGSAR